VGTLCSRSMVAETAVAAVKAVAKAVSIAIAPTTTTAAATTTTTTTMLLQALASHLKNHDGASLAAVASKVPVDAHWKSNTTEYVHPSQKTNDPVSVN
jgi:hypothetical protein